MNTIEQLHSITEVAKRLGMPRWRLAYLIEQGDLPEASLKVPGRRLFTDDDLDKLQDAVDKLPPRYARRNRWPGSKSNHDNSQN